MQAKRLGLSASANNWALIAPNFQSNFRRFDDGKYTTRRHFAIQMQQIRRRTFPAPIRSRDGM